jgi:hypothetical protein
MCIQNHKYGNMEITTTNNRIKNTSLGNENNVNRFADNNNYCEVTTVGRCYAPDRKQQKNGVFRAVRADGCARNNEYVMPSLNTEHNPYLLRGMRVQ